jgi:hypothetical protein
VLDRDRAVLLWLAGTYDSQHAYDQRVVARLVSRSAGGVG